MAEKWFAGCGTVDAIKARYRALAKQYHPDVTHDPGTTATMADINVQYKQALAACDGQTYRGADDQEHTYHYNAATEEALAQVIIALLRLHMPDVRIVLIGSWIWVIGDTRPHKDSLKQLGLFWNPRRGAWSYHVGAWHGRPSPHSLAGLAAEYGASEYTQEDIAAA